MGAVSDVRRVCTSVCVGHVCTQEPGQSRGVLTTDTPRLPVSRVGLGGGPTLERRRLRNCSGELASCRPARVKVVAACLSQMTCKKNKDKNSVSIPYKKMIRIIW